MNRQFYQARQAAGNINLPANTAQVPTVFTDVTSVTFTPDANAAYAIYWYVEAYQSVGGISSTDYHHFQLLMGAATPMDLVHAKGRGTAVPYDGLTHTGVWVLPASASPTSMTITLRGCCGATSSRQQVARNGSLVVLRLEARDRYNQNAARIETQAAGGTYTGISTSTPDSGTYIVFGACAQDGASAAAGVTTYLSPTVNTTGTFSPIVIQPPNRASDTGFFVPSIVIGRSAAASTVANLNMNPNSGVAYQATRNHCIVALYEADLPGVTIIQDLAQYTTGVPTAYELMYQSGGALPAAGSRLTFASFAACALGSANNDIPVHLTVDGVETNGMTLRNFQASATRGWYGAYMHYESAVPAGRDYRLEWYKYAGTTTGLTTPHRQFVVLDLAAPGGTVEPPAPERRPLRIGRFL